MTGANHDWVAAAAAPTDLVQNLRLAPNKNVRTFLTAYIGYTWNRHYGAPLATFGGPQTRGILTRLAQNNCIELHSKPKLSTILGILTLQNRLKNVDLGRVQPWAGLARRNSPSSRGINYPLMIAQNPKDDLVAPSVTRTYARAVCDAGSRMTFIDIDGAGHATSARDSATRDAPLDRRSLRRKTGRKRLPPNLAQRTRMFVFIPNMV